MQSWTDAEIADLHSAARQAGQSLRYHPDRAAEFFARLESEAARHEDRYLAVLARIGMSLTLGAPTLDQHMRASDSLASLLRPEWVESGDHALGELLARARSLMDVRSQQLLETESVGTEIITLVDERLHHYVLLRAAMLQASQALPDDAKLALSHLRNARDLAERLGDRAAIAVALLGAAIVALAVPRDDKCAATVPARELFTNTRAHAYDAVTASAGTYVEHSVRSLAKAVLAVRHARPLVLPLDEGQQAPLLRGLLLVVQKYLSPPGTASRGDRQSEAAPSDLPPDGAALFEMTATADLDSRAFFLQRPPLDSVEPLAVAPRLAGETQSLTDMRFSAHYPKEVSPSEWSDLHAYAFSGASSNEVREDIARTLGGELGQARHTERPAAAPIPLGAIITATPRAEQCTFNPHSVSVALLEPWHRFDFRFTANPGIADQAANGSVTFTAAGIIVADVPLSVYVGARSEETTLDLEPVSPYSRIFPSYSHRDRRVVERVEAASRVFGLEFLRDATTLRSGERWDERLLELIDAADVFQLFWSSRAAGSPYVAREWRHAMKTHGDRDRFVRPVYWTRTMPPAPKELAHIHFEYCPQLRDKTGWPIPWGHRAHDAT